MLVRRALLSVILTITLLAASSCPAWAMDFSGYKERGDSQARAVEVVNPGFEEGAAGWTLLEGYKVVEGKGIGGTCCMEFNKNGSSYDLLGVDPYVIANEESRNMARVKLSMDMSERAGLPVWVVPQIFNWGVYDARNDPEKFKKYTDPTEEQMRSVSLLMALRGAKGFIFYCYNDLRKVPPLAPEDFDRRWPEVCRVGKMLRDLEPFILSDTEPEMVETACKQGEVEARLFRDGTGGVRVLVAGIGPGESEAVITLPASLRLLSAYGNTTPEGDGRHLFRGKDICSDILASEL